ncbi:MAG: hypothetical protein N3E45_00860 [Oscillatoriaceae bacterium SKW80]|nr:hypothetical protein [Oscillatoriaceae bacterium SKYG93]MCX8119379.1 hypothetical protein [Oscillatoriaceae bacterium SKW80]MDW8454846.1 hypothetical protein [Oscillatoriaceae cyanobacterium SKYGB_i_bin93]HIK28375.1 hypothetical protein [Oscillatoriaceae cyanobacterium M7585_C2015_266]
MLTNKRLLRKNPFNAYRDPETGRWIVVKTEQEEQAEPIPSPSKLNASTESEENLAER